MTIQLRWPLRVLTVALSPFVMLAVGRGAFLAIEAFALWIGLEASLATFAAGYFGIFAGCLSAIAMVIGAFRTWRPDNPADEKGSG